MHIKWMIRSLLHSTKLPSIHLTATSEDSGCCDSKFGGTFYLPQGEAVPRCPEGEEMECLAQINFAQLPRSKCFPKEGLCQFFVDTDAKRFEAKFDDPVQYSELYEVRFYPHPDPALQQEGVHGPDPERESRLKAPWKQGKMTFQTKQEVASVYLRLDDEGWGGQFRGDFGYDDPGQIRTLSLLTRISGYDIENWGSELEDFIWDFGNSGCKLGGHPHLYQFDPRTEQELLQPYSQLLFQYDLSSRKLEPPYPYVLLFFIKPEDLKQGQFQNALLHCYAYM